MDRGARLAEPILLVEDKDSLRTMLRLALDAQGYAVVEARDGGSASHGWAVPGVRGRVRRECEAR